MAVFNADHIVMTTGKVGIIVRLKTAAILGAMFVATVGLAAPAQATFSDCGDNKVCLWGNNDFAFLIGQRGPGEGGQNLGGDSNNEMDSWGNRTTRTAAGYDDRGLQGDCQTFGAGQRDNNVSPLNSDELSSWKTNGGC